MSSKKKIEVVVEGGKVTAGPPLGPALGPIGVNVLAVAERANELTKDYVGMRVPIEVIVNVETKEFEVKVGTPTVSALIVKELGISKGSSSKGEIAGNLTIGQVVKIAKIKREFLLSKSLKGAIKEIVGTCLSMGVTVDGRGPREVLRLIDEGYYDAYLKE